MTLALAIARVVLGVLAFRGVRWAYVSFIALALMYFPLRSGFVLAPRSCQVVFGLDLALFSFTNYAHIVLFAVFFGMSCAQFARGTWANRSTFVKAAIATVAMGAAVELAQGITGNGHCRARDLIPDSAGILLGAGVITLWDRMRPRIRLWRKLATAITLTIGIGTLNADAQGSPAGVPYARRMAAAYDRLGNDLLILRSAWSPASSTAARFDQDASFLYFTGAESVIGGVLVLDGRARRSVLFLPNELPGGLKAVAPNQPTPGGASPSAFHVDGVSEWSALGTYLAGRLARDPRSTIRVDESALDGSTAGRLGTPFDSLATLGNPHRAWRRLVQQHVPNATVRGDIEVTTGLRAFKDSNEIAMLRRAATTSVAAFNAGLARFSPGQRQRHVEAAVVETCVRLGNGPSFWPWVMSGSNAAFPTPWTSSLDHRNLDRVMLAGEVARFDVGCQVDHYMGDVGRTVPVSGTFTAGQREVIDLLVAAYRAGLVAIRDGTTVSDVIRASVAEVARRRPRLRTALGSEAASVITRPDGIPYWQVHGIGLEAPRIYIAERGLTAAVRVTPLRLRARWASTSLRAPSTPSGWPPSGDRRVERRDPRA